MRRRSIQELFADAKSGASGYLNSAYDRFNNNRAVFRKGRPSPSTSGIQTVPFDVGLEADNARRGGMSENQIQAMLEQARRPGLPISPTVLASVQRPMVEKSNNANAPRGIASLSRKQRNRARMLNEGFLIPQGSVPGADGRRVRVGVPNVLYPDQTVPSGPNRLGPAAADYLGLRLINPASAEYAEMSNLSPAEADAMRMRNEYGTADPTPTIPEVIDKERIARDVSYITTDMPGGGGTITAAPAILPMEMDIGDRGGRLPSSTRPEYSPDKRVSDSAAATPNLYVAGSPTDRARKMPNLEQAYGSPPVPAVKSMPRPMPKPQMDTGKDAELDAGIDQKVDAPKEEPQATDAEGSNIGLIRLGLQIAKEASKPGATLLGAIAGGAANALEDKDKRDLIASERKFKKDTIKDTQDFKALQAKLERQFRGNKSDKELAQTEESLRLKSVQIANTLKVDNDRLTYLRDKLDKDDNANRDKLNAQMEVNDAQANYYNARAAGESNKLQGYAVQTHVAALKYVATMLPPADRRSMKPKEMAARRKQAIKLYKEANGLSGLDLIPDVAKDLDDALDPTKTTNIFEDMKK